MGKENERSVMFDPEDTEFFKRHPELNPSGIVRQLTKEFREKNYFEELDFDCWALASNEVRETYISPERKVIKFQRANSESIEEMNERKANLPKDLPNDNPELFFLIEPKRISDIITFGTPKTQTIKLIKGKDFNRIYLKHINTNSPLCQRQKEEWKQRENDAQNKATQKYHSDIKKISDRKRFLDGFADKHLNEVYKKEQKIQEEQDAKLQILLKDFEKIDKRALQVIELIGRSKDKTRKLKLSKDLEELKNKRNELVSQIMDADQNFTFKRFTW